MAKIKYAYKLNANFNDFGITFRRKYNKRNLYRTLCPCGFHSANYGYIRCPQCNREIKALNDAEEAVNMSCVETSNGFIVYLEFFNYFICGEEVVVKCYQRELFSYQNSVLTLLAPDIYHCDRDFGNRFFINAPSDKDFFRIIDNYIPDFTSCLKYVFTANIPYMYYYVIFMLVHRKDIYNSQFFAANCANVAKIFLKMFIETDIDWQEEIKNNDTLFL